MQGETDRRLRALAARRRHGAGETAADTRRTRLAMMGRCAAHASRVRPSVRQAGACNACNACNAYNAYNAYDNYSAYAGRAARCATRSGSRSSRSTCSPRVAAQQQYDGKAEAHFFSYRRAYCFRTVMLRIIRTLLFRIIRTLILRIVRTLILWIIRTAMPD